LLWEWRSQGYKSLALGTAFKIPMYSKKLAFGVMDLTFLSFHILLLRLLFRRRTAIINRRTKYNLQQIISSSRLKTQQYPDNERAENKKTLDY
jgi:hypothetical protein